MNILTYGSLLYSILLIIVFFSRKRIKSVENKIYSLLIISNFFGLLIAIACYFTVLNYDKIPIINNIVSRLYLLYLLIYILLFFYYLIVIIYQDSKNIKRISSILLKIIIAFGIVITTLVFALDLYYNNSDGLVYSYGPAANVLYIVSTICMSLWTVLLLINYKKIKNKKFIPIITFIIGAMITTIVQKLNPELLLMTSMETFVLIIMYFTIENPDMKLLSEIKKSKDLAEQSNTEKAMFLYNTSQEIKRPVQAIEEKCGEMLDEYELSDDLKEDLRDIKFAAKRLSTTINGVLDMNNSTKNTNIEIMHKKYNIKNLFKEITSMSKISITEQEKQLDFRSNIDDSIPEYLMGDSIRLKQIITTIVNNAIKHTSTGFIEFNISYVVKHNNCRLIMSVEDSGEGIESSKLETLFYGNEDDLDDDGTYKVDDTRKSLSFIKVLTNLIGGTVIVNSELGKGSKFTVVLDQEISQEKKSSTMIAIEKLNSTKKILVVDDEEESLKQITKLLNKYDVNVDTVMWGQECLERIRKNQKYDLILLDEDMPRLNGIKTFEKLKLEDNFDIPVVIMINESHIEYKDRYLLNGFGGVLVKPLNKKELDKIMDKYIKVDE